MLLISCNLAQTAQLTFRKLPISRAVVWPLVRCGTTAQIMFSKLTMVLASQHWAQQEPLAPLVRQAQRCVGATGSDGAIGSTGE